MKLTQMMLPQSQRWMCENMKNKSMETRQGWMIIKSEYRMVWS